MITNTQSEGYQLAKELAEHWLKHHNEQFIQETFDIAASKLKWWERAAISDTFKQLIKQQ